MEDEIFGFVDGDRKQSKTQDETVETNFQSVEKTKGVASTAKSKKKEETKYEKDLREAKEALKKTKSKLDELKETEAKARTEEQKKEFKELSKKLQEQKYELAKARREYDRDKNSRTVRQQKKKLDEGKQQAIIKILQAEGIETENEVKDLISIRRIIKRYGIEDDVHLKNILDYVVRNRK